MSEEPQTYRILNAIAVVAWLVAYLFFVWTLYYAQVMAAKVFVHLGVDLPMPTRCVLWVAQIVSLLAWTYLGVVICSILWFSAHSGSARLRKVFLSLALGSVLAGGFVLVSIQLPVHKIQETLRKK